MSKTWDNNVLKKLKALMGKGLSTSEMGKKLGMSKNAIVGKLHRLGWNTKAIEEPKASSGKSAVAKKAPAKKVVTKKTPVKTPAKAPATKKTTPAKKSAAPVVKKKTTKVATPKAKVAKVTPQKKTAEEPKKKVVGRAITGRNTSVHQRIVQHALEMANLKPNQCRWPIGDPDSEGFHFCGAPVFVGKPYCYEHCKQAYQFAPPKKK
jgi:GcrA cell cycle regulator